MPSSIPGISSTSQSPQSKEHERIKYSEEGYSESPHSSSGEQSITGTSPAPLILSHSHQNAHHGTLSTWRSRTVSERKLAASLDQLSAKDLAIHLYNAFALKKRAASIKSQTEPNAHIEEQAWRPPSVWTAWPLAPDIVPAVDEGLRWDSESYSPGHSHSKKPCPREALEDILVGLLQKEAKHRFWKRQRSEDSLGLPDVHLNDDEELAWPEPVVMADDDLARNLAQPTIRHVLAKFDELLASLHHARNAYMTIDEPTSDSYDISIDQDIRQKRKPSSKGQQGGSKRRKTNPRFSTDPPPSQLETDLRNGDKQKNPKTRNHEQSTAKGRASERLTKHKHRCGLRDWSDVTGIAAMTGWEPKTVQKAAARCANLFGEGLKFRTLEENENTWNEFSILPNKLSGELESDISRKDQDANNEPTPVAMPRSFDGDRQESRFYCPITDCNRSRRGFSAASRLTRHLKQVHKDLNLQGVSYEIEDQMVGGVHVDGFLRPVPAPGAWATKSRSAQGKERSRQSKDQ